MQQVLKVSRKIEYGLRAMIYLASMAPGAVVPFREIARAMEIPQDFLAQILKTLVNAGVVQSLRGAHGGYRLGRKAEAISFLDVIEAVEGPVQINVCLNQMGKDVCGLSPACTMYSVWKEAQEKMLEVYRAARLDRLALNALPKEQPLQALHTPPSPTAA